MASRQARNSCFETQTHAHENPVRFGALYVSPPPTHIGHRLQGMNVRHLRRHQLPNGHLHLVLGVGQRRQLRFAAVRADKLLPRGRQHLEHLQRGGQIIVLEVEGDRQRLGHPELRVRVEQLVQLALLRVAQSEQAGPALLRVLGEELRGGQTAAGGRGVGVGGVVWVLGGGGLEELGGSLAGTLQHKMIVFVCVRISLSKCNK